MLDQERRESGTDYQDHGLLFCCENRTPSPAVSSGWRRPDCPRSTFTTCANGERRVVAPEALFQEVVNLEGASESRQLAR
jgi:hypothetical protein